MKKTFASIFFVLFIASASYAQIGLGLGSAGINVKSSAENKLRVIGRANFSLVHSQSLYLRLVW